MVKPPIDVIAPAEQGKREDLMPRRGNDRRRLVVNITPLERVGRVAVGAIGAIGGALLLALGGGALAIVLESLLVLAGHAAWSTRPTSPGPPDASAAESPDLCEGSYMDQLRS